jgi:type II secretory ATPase GspE/PulE/Tfp pilus assembly ATPase PilB-like protein
VIVIAREPRQHEAHDVTALVDDLLARGLTAGATDLHFEPTDGDMLVRLRIDGQLLDFETVPKRLSENVLSRLKVLASLLTYRVDIPQEGSVQWPKARGDGNQDPVDLRIATFPTIRGERAVVRVFSHRSDLNALDRLGLPQEQWSALAQAVMQPAGLIVVTGPAGSGKTTTLYVMIRHLAANASERSVITLEDPVEQRIDRVTQIQINPYGELDYERCMRSLLRQDPQVILIGEVRDGRTAGIAIEAALTGHLILTTMHSADPAETIVRFLDMGIAPYQLVSALTMVCSQRLLRRICHECNLDSRAACQRCLGTGYSGRTAVAQLARIDEATRRLMLQYPTTAQLRERFKKHGPDLLEYASLLVTGGITDEREVARVLGSDVQWTEERPR